MRLKKWRQVAWTLLVAAVFAMPATADGGKGDRAEPDAARRAFLDQILALSADDDPDRPNPRLGDFARVKWVQADRRRAGVTWRDATWSDWLRRTGELPPDFDAMRSQPFLPDPLLGDESGRSVPIASPAQWPARRQWIGRQVQHWITGTVPPPPNNLAAETLDETRAEGAVFRRVLLRFGPQRRALLALRLWVPGGRGPRPVLVTQSNTAWAQAAVRRGYIACLYAGDDAADDTDAYGPLYPDFDFARLMRRAWGCSRAIDYLETLAEVDRRQIVLVGHSRNGFQALLAAAMDERIAAVIPASATLGLNGFRYSDRHGTQTLDEFTYAFPYWLHPRLRWFVGREHKLPVDMNLVMAMVAPRPMLLTGGVREPDGNPWATEQLFHSLRRVYRLLGAENRLALRWRDGNHGLPKGEFDIYLDFFDTALGRSSAYRFPNTLYYPYDFERWKSRSDESIDAATMPAPRKLDDAECASPLAWTGRRAETRRHAAWLLGSPPAASPRIDGRLSDPSPGDEARLNGQAAGLMPFDTPRMPRQKLSIGPMPSGERLTVWLTRPRQATGKLPAVVFLHEHAYATGFFLRAGPLLERFVDVGAAVATLDLIGCQSRIEEGAGFYDRHPRWSLLGKMVDDVRAVVTALEHLDFVDSRRICLIGPGLGGCVAIFTAATDERVAGIAVCNAFTPLRCASAEVEGIRAYSHLHGLVPRLGFFLGHEDRIPVDFDDLLASIAPRPVLVIAQQFDRHADPRAMTACLRSVGRVYDLLGAAKAFEVERPGNFNRFSGAEKERILQWFKAEIRPDRGQPGAPARATKPTAP
ncbi:MAG: hypothetical protein ABR915_12675 [Thermoguttaceae bacterium]